MEEICHVCRLEFFPKLVYRFNIIPIKIPAGFFFYLQLSEIQRTMNSQSNLKKKKELEDQQLQANSTGFKT